MRRWSSSQAGWSIGFGVWPLSGSLGCPGRL